MSSSNVPQDGIGYFSDVLGIRGDTGPTGYGPRGPVGPSIFGVTGSSGATLVNIVKLSDNFFEFFYSDGTSKLSESQIIGSQGYAKIALTGVSLANFSPLSNSLEDQTYNDKFPVDVLTFKGISSNYDPILRILQTSSETNPTAPETILVDYSAVNIGFIGISGGTLGNILENKTGQRQYGITSSFYNANEEAILIQNKNIQEGLVTISPIVFDSSLACYKIDPDLGSVFYLNPYTSNLNTNNEINGFALLVKKPTLTNHSTGISLHFSPGFTYSGNIYYVTYEDESDISNGITFGSEFYSRFDLSGIAWQNDSYFCPAKQKFNVVNMISLGGRYLAYPVQYDSSNASNTIETSTLNEDCYPFGQEIDVEDPTNFSETGLCCPCDGSNEGVASETFSSNCNGYFWHGKTLADSSLCSTIGFCCYNSGNIQTETTFCNCKSLDPNGLWYPYYGERVNSSFFFCDPAFVANELGLCCDGLGNGDLSAKNNCLENKKYFHGVATNVDGTVNGIPINICNSGTGGCCYSGLECLDNKSFTECISEGRYAGDNLSCGQINCSPDNIPCDQTILNIVQGDPYSDGIILDYFNFNNFVYGHEFFTNSTNASKNQLTQNPPSNSLSIIGNFQIQYNSVKDFTGYGINSSSDNLICRNSDNFIIIIAKEDITLNETNFFRWSKSDVSWGPLIDPITRQRDPLDNLNVNLSDEGYMFTSSSNRTIPQLLNPTFSNCDQIRINNNYKEWLFNRSKQSICGIWTRNYGLYNTTRLIGSRIFNILNAYAPNPSLDGNTIAEAIIHYNIQNPPNNPNESSWFIPSHDEMALIANLIRIQTDFNINASLALNGYSPLSGQYWTSTGAFDITKNEGYLNSTVPGSIAWRFDLTDPNSINSIAVNRTDKYKVRPIKIIRCDGRYPRPSDDNYKLWRLPLINI